METRRWNQGFGPTRDKARRFKMPAMREGSKPTMPDDARSRSLSLASPLTSPDAGRPPSAQIFTPYAIPERRREATSAESWSTRKSLYHPRTTPRSRLLRRGERRNENQMKPSRAKIRKTVMRLPRKSAGVSKVFLGRRGLGRRRRGRRTCRRGSGRARRARSCPRCPRMRKAAA